MFAQTRNHSASTAASNTPPPRASWQWQLIKTDFRHAFWPWVGYVAAIIILMISSDPNDVAGFLIFFIVFVSSGVLTQIFTTDQSHGTLSSLIAFPVSRTAIWLRRVLLYILLMVLPIAVASLFLPQDYPEYDEAASPAKAFLVLTTFISWSHLTLGSFLAVVLKKKIQVWSANVISPFVIMLIYFVVRNLFDLENDANIRSNFPWLNQDVSFFNLLIGCIFAACSYRFWQRMEVRA